MVRYEGLALGTMLLVACTAAPPVGEQRQALVGGMLNLTNHAVVAVRVHPASDPSMGTLCSGSVVSPHVVLTAAHCINPAENGDDAVYAINVADDIYGSMSSDADVYTVKETHFDPDYDATTGLHNIGVLITDMPLPITPLAINREPLEQALVGMQAHVIGYGLSDPAHYDRTHYGQRRDAMITIASVGADFITFGDTTAGTCVADSGGPTLIAGASGETIVAVHQAVISMLCNGLDRDSRIDLYATAFVDPLIAAAEGVVLPTADAGSGDDAGVAAADEGGCAIAARAPGGRAVALVLLLLVASLGLRRTAAGSPRERAA